MLLWLQSSSLSFWYVLDRYIFSSGGFKFIFVGNTTGIAPYWSRHRYSWYVRPLANTNPVFISFFPGLSWLIGGSLQEVLTSIIFLFVKHPFDVGDRVTVDTTTYTVKEMRLLSTIFLDGSGTYVQATNFLLNGKVRRLFHFMRSYTEPL